MKRFPFDLAAKQYGKSFLFEIKRLKPVIEGSWSKSGRKSFSLNMPYAWPARALYVLDRLKGDYELDVRGYVLVFLETLKPTTHEKAMLRCFALEIPDTSQMPYALRGLFFTKWYWQWDQLELYLDEQLDKQIDELAAFFLST